MHLVPRAKILTCPTDPNNIHEWFNISSKIIEGSVTWGVILVPAFITEFLRISSRNSQYFVIKVVY